MKMLKRSAIAALVTLALPIVAVALLSGYYAITNNFCSSGSIIATLGAAIAAAKRYVADQVWSVNLDIKEDYTIQ
jgi:hypothetical protein